MDSKHSSHDEKNGKDSIENVRPHDKDWPPKYNPEKDAERRRRYRKEIEGAVRDYWLRAQKERPHYTPWLVIRYAPGDVGLRPVPNGVAFWLSPDIWVQSSDPNGNAVAGEQNYLWVRIFNLGRATAAPVRIDYYWANPALGLGAANMNLIGTEWVEIRSQFSREVKCSSAWVPVIVNNGHECLKVNCSSPILDPLKAPFDARLDRHVGQRNITVVPGTAGGVVPFRLELNNFLPMTARTAVFARAAHVAVSAALRREVPRLEVVNRLAMLGGWVPQPVEMQARFSAGTAAHRAAVLSGRWAPKARATSAARTAIRTHDGAGLRIAASISADRTRLLETGARGAFARMLAAGEILAFDHGAPGAPLQRLDEITMEPLEGRQVDLELHIPPAAQPGEHVVFHLEQWTQDLNLGGYTVVVEVGQKRKPPIERAKSEE